METTPRYQPDPRPFAFRGGELALDFCNTLSPADRTDRLYDYDRLVEWAAAGGVLSPADARRLRRLAAQRPEDAKAALAAAQEVRGALLRLFEAVSEGLRPPTAELAVLNAHLPRTLGALRLSEAGGEWTWAWAKEAQQLELPLHQVVRSAAELLTGPQRRARVRACASDDCRWFFLDTSKNRSRRWCDMADCGNRAKARRHYRRQKEGEPG